MAEGDVQERTRPYRFMLIAPPCPGTTPRYPAVPASMPAVSSPPEAGKRYVMVRGLDRQRMFRDDRD